MEKEVLESLSRWLEEDDLEDIDDWNLPTFDELFPATEPQAAASKSRKTRKSERKKRNNWFRKKV